MLRETIGRQLDHDPRFHWRGGSVTRIENLSDIVFALALGILVSSSTSPQTFSELNAHLLSIVPVAAGFALLVSIWNAHFVFFRRYGVADARVIFLNAVLLLVVLFVAYPLRFIFDSLFGYILGLMGDWSRLEAAGITSPRAGVIMGYFCIGYAAVYGLVSLMYSHALSKADLLALNATERAMTKRSIWIYRCQILAALVTGAAAVFSPMHAFAGWLMGLIWPLIYIVGRLIPLPAATGGDEPDL